MDVKLEQDLFDDGETIEDHYPIYGTVDMFNVYSISYCITLVSCGVLLLWVMAKIWVRSGLSRDKSQ